MTVKEATELLKTAPKSETKPARMNPVLTQAQAVKIVQDRIDAHEEKDGFDYVLGSIIEKRVYQVVRNQRRPKY